MVLASEASRRRLLATMPSADPGAFDAAAALLVPIVRSSPGAGDASALDGGAAIGRLLVALRARHLAASWDARLPVDPDAIRSALDLDRSWRPAGVVGVGPAAVPAP